MMNLKYYLRGLGIGIVVTALIMGIAVGGKKEALSNEEIKERAKALGMIEESTVLADTFAEDRKEEPENTAAAPEEAKGGDAAQPETAEGAEAPDTEESLETAAAPEISQSPEASASPEAAKSPEASALPEVSSGSGISAASEVSEKRTVATPEALESAETAEPDVPQQVQAADVPAETSEEIKEEPAPKTTEAPAAADENVQGGAQASGSMIIEVKDGDSSYSVCEKLEEAGLISSAYEFDMYLLQNGYDKRIKVGTFEIPADADSEKIARTLVRLE